MQVYSGEISFHVVSINLTKHEYLAPTSQLGRYLGHLTLDVKDKIENTPTV